MVSDNQLNWRVKVSGNRQIGQRGPAGPSGPPGAILTYVHIQVDPTVVWSIQHSLGRYPSVTVVDSAGAVVIGDVHYLTDQTVQVSFSSPFAGRAYLN